MVMECRLQCPFDGDDDGMDPSPDIDDPLPDSIEPGYCGVWVQVNSLEMTANNQPWKTSPTQGKWSNKFRWQIDLLNASESDYHRLDLYYSPKPNLTTRVRLPYGQESFYIDKTTSASNEQGLFVSYIKGSVKCNNGYEEIDHYPISSFLMKPSSDQYTREPFDVPVVEESRDLVSAVIHCYGSNLNYEEQVQNSWSSGAGINFSVVSAQLGIAGQVQVTIKQDPPFPVPPGKKGKLYRLGFKDTWQVNIFNYDWLGQKGTEYPYGLIYFHYFGLLPELEDCP